MEYDVDELPEYDFSKADAKVFEKIEHEKSGVSPSSNCVDLIEKWGRGVILRIPRVICIK